MNHHDAEKGSQDAAPYDYDTKNGVYSDAPPLGAATVAAEGGHGGDTHRGLKSRHIQFL